MTDHASIPFSPLKSVRIPVLIDRTTDFVERPLGRSPHRPSPPRSESERPVWVALPKGSLYPTHKDLAAPYIPIPTRLAYRPNLRPPPQIGINPSANHPVSSNCDINNKGRKVIVSRQLLVNGNITFVVGTRFGGIVNRDPKEVPLSQILHHVSPAELQRFENQDFLEEDIREATRPSPKPKGRPVGSRLIDGRLVLGGVSAGPSREQKRQAQPSVVLPSSSGALQQGAALAPSSRTSHLAVKVPATNGSQLIAVHVPSFNGPQPGHIKHVSETDASSETSEDELSGQRPTRRPQYAMVAASGLAPSETSLEEETSRDVSMSRAPSHEALLSYDREQSPKRQRLDTQLPLRDTGPITQLAGSHATPKPDSDKRTFFDNLFQQSAPSASMTEKDRIVYNSLNGHANSLPSMWPTNASVTVAAQDDPYPPLESSFPPGFDRGRYPAHRRRRGNKSYNPKRLAASVSDTLFNSSIPATRVAYNSPAQSELEDVEMVDMVDVRDEEAEREALLRQFQPTNIQQSRKPSSSSKMSKFVIAPPQNRPKTASSSLSTEEACVLAQDILSKVNGQSQHARPQITPSVQVSTPTASITPHYPHGVKFGSDTLNRSPNHKSHDSRPNHLPSRVKTPSAIETMHSPIEREKSLGLGTSSKARLAKSSSSDPTSRTVTKTTATGPLKPPHSDPTTLTFPIKNHSINPIKLSASTNGTSNKRSLKSPTPANDITKYFHPKSSTAKPPPPPASEADETESEDPLTRASSYDSLNRNIPVGQRRSLRESPNPAPAQIESGSDSDSLNPNIPIVQHHTQGTIPTSTQHPALAPALAQDDSENENNIEKLNSEILLVQHRTPIQAHDNSSQGQDETYDLEVAYSGDEHQEELDLDNEDDDRDQETMQMSEQLSNQLPPASTMRASGRIVGAEDVDVDGSDGEQEVVEISSGSETDSLDSEVLVVQPRRG